MEPAPLSVNRLVQPAPASVNRLMIPAPVDYPAKPAPVSVNYPAKPVPASVNRLMVPAPVDYPAKPAPAPVNCAAKPAPASVNRLMVPAPVDYPAKPAPDTVNRPMEPSPAAVNRPAVPAPDSINRESSERFKKFMIKIERKVDRKIYALYFCRTLNFINSLFHAFAIVVYVALLKSAVSFEAIMWYIVGGGSIVNFFMELFTLLKYQLDGFSGIMTFRIDDFLKKIASIHTAMCFISVGMLVATLFTSIWAQLPIVLILLLPLSPGISFFCNYFVVHGAKSFDRSLFSDFRETRNYFDEMSPEDQAVYQRQEEIVKDLFGHNCESPTRSRSKVYVA